MKRNLGPFLPSILKSGTRTYSKFCSLISAFCVAFQLFISINLSLIRFLDDQGRQTIIY